MTEGPIGVSDAPSTPPDAAAEEGPVATIRLRIAPADARYAGGICAGSKTLEIFADLETELALLEGGDEGLCAGYDSVEFLAPVRVGDFVEGTARVVSRGRTSRRILAELHVVHRVDGDGVLIAHDAPVLAARASVTIVVGRTVAARAEAAGSTDGSHGAVEVAG